MTSHSTHIDWTKLIPSFLFLYREFGDRVLLTLFEHHHHPHQSHHKVGLQVDVDPIQKEVVDNQIQMPMVELVVEQELVVEEEELGAEVAITTNTDEVAVVETTTITRDEAVLPTNKLNSSNNNNSSTTHNNILFPT